MFQDEASFGRINTPQLCWAPKGTRPTVPCHRVREYMHAYGAVEPVTGDSFFLILPKSNTICMNLFLGNLSKEYENDMIVLVCDGAPWHKSKELKIPKNIIITFIPPYTPEMNPIEQIWKEIRKMSFHNVCFKTLGSVVDVLSDTICSLSNELVKSVTGREWIFDVF